MPIDIINKPASIFRYEDALRSYLPTELIHLIYKINLQKYNDEIKILEEHRENNRYNIYRISFRDEWGGAEYTIKDELIIGYENPYSHYHQFYLKSLALQPKKRIPKKRMF